MTATVTEQTCIRCGQIKPISVFRRHKGRKTGFTKWCKPCYNKHETERIRRVKAGLHIPKRLTESYNLEALYPDVAKEWHPTKNGNLSPLNVGKGSNIKVWWKCDKADDHEWETWIRSRTSVLNCPMCAGQKVVLSNCLATTHPEIAKEWHPTKNGDLTPYDVVPGTLKKVWWICKYNHEWPATTYKIGRASCRERV